VLKVHQRCNLACDYCYVYEHADQSWRRRATVMPPHVVEAAARRIGEHAAAHRLDRVRLVLHGGEPLLAGRDRLRSMVATLRAALPCPADVTLQTNGTLLDEAMLDRLRADGVSVGVSLDGPPGANDRHRRYADGRGSSGEVHRALSLLSQTRHRDVYAGLLCTVDPESDPIGCFEALLAFDPPAVDFLLPHATWEHPPPGHDPDRTPYANWLLAVFERWYTAPRQKTTRIRLFENLMDLALGGHVRSESTGLGDTDFLVVESDGTIELSDSLKATRNGAAATGIDIFAHDFDTVARHPVVADARRGGLEALADVCRDCEVVRLCGGGLRAHRFHPRNGFANPSVYCADLRVLTTRIRDRVLADAPARLRSAS